MLYEVITKYRSLKKSDLVYQILDHQAADPKSIEQVINPTETVNENKPAENRDKKQRARIKKPIKNTPNKNVDKGSESVAQDRITSYNVCYTKLLRNIFCCLNNLCFCNLWII